MQTGLIAFDIVSKINGVNIDLRSVAREYALNNEEISPEELLRIIKRFDFKAKVKNISIDEIIEKYPLPSIILRKDGQYDVLLKADKTKNRVLIFSIQDNQSKDIDFKELEKLCDNNFIILSHKLINSQIKFGFKWFVF